MQCVCRVPVCFLIFFLLYFFFLTSSIGDWSFSLLSIVRERSNQRSIGRIDCEWFPLLVESDNGSVSARHTPGNEPPCHYRSHHISDAQNPCRLHLLYAKSPLLKPSRLREGPCLNTKAQAPEDPTVETFEIPISYHYRYVRFDDCWKKIINRTI